TTWSLPFANTAFPFDGSYTVHALAIDEAGNVETGGLSATFNYDTTPPVTSIEVSGPSAASVSVTFTASDATSGVAATYYALDGASQQAYTGMPFMVSGYGTHQITFWSVDNAGNAETVESDSFTIQTPTLFSDLSAP